MVLFHRFALIIGVVAVLVGSLVAGPVAYEGVVLAQDNPDGAGVLTLLHNNDGESTLLPIEATVPPGIGFANTVTETLEIGGVAAFKTLTDQNIADARSQGSAVVNVYAGDAFLASATLVCTLDAPDGPVYDAVAQRQIPYTAHILGNHEFDYTPDFLARFIRAFAVDGQLTQPFLSTNLDFRGEPGFADLLAVDEVITPPIEDGRVVGGALIHTDPETNQRFGIVGVTTPALRTISSPRNVTLEPNPQPSLDETAIVVQATIDRLYDEFGVRKIILVSHLQDLDNDRELIRRLSRVDVAVGGGGDELLTTDRPDTTELLPGDEPAQSDDGTNLPYPLVEQDRDGRNVYIVTTAGNYTYLGRLDVEFDDNGEVSRVLAERSYPRRVVPASETAAALGITDAVTPDPTLVAEVNQPIENCLAGLAATNVARSEVLLDVSRDGVRGRETNAGNMIADAFLAAYDRYAPELGLPARSEINLIAVQNGGGIRQNAGDVLPTGGAPGTISRRNTIDVLPFANFVTVIGDVSPADLKAILERSAEALPGTGGQFLQIAGFRVVYDPQRAVGSRVVSASLEDGTPLIQDGVVVEGAPTLTVITNSFTASGGDDYETFANNPNKTQLPVSYEQAWREYLASFPSGGDPGLPTIPADDPRYQPGGEGRITILAAAPAPPAEETQPTAAAPAPTAEAPVATPVPVPVELPRTGAGSDAVMWPLLAVLIGVLLAGGWFMRRRAR